MRDILSRTGVGTSEFFFGSDWDWIGRLKIYLDRDRIGCLNFFLYRIGIGSVDSKQIGSESDRLTQKNLDRDRIGIGSVFMKN